MKRICDLVIATSVATVVGLFAQEGSGKLSGIVTDSTQAVLPGVVVVVHHRATGLSRTVTTEASGDYVFPNLPIGIYDVTASKQGFTTLRSIGVTIAVGTPTRMDLELQVSAIVQEVTIQAKAPLLSTESGEGSVLLNSGQITNLPLNGRNFLQLVTLQPGVRQSTTTGRMSFNINGSPAGQGINFLVDGTDATGIESTQVGGIFAAPGQSTFSLSLDSISEFVVHANNYSVRYGRALGGVIEAVTKSGTNSLRGNVFHFLRNSALNANSIQANAAGLERVPLRFNQFGGNAGGPIVKNKMFFWAGYEGARRRSGLARTFTVLSNEGRARVTDPAIAKFVEEWLPRPNTPPTTNPNIALLVRNDVGKVREDIGTIRYDLLLSGKDTLFVRYNIHDTLGFMPGLIPEKGSTTATRQQLGTISDTHIFGPATTLNVRVGANRMINDRPTLGPNPGLTVSGLFGLSGDFLNNHATSYTFATDLSHLHGRHTLSLGHEYRTTRVNRDQRNNASYTFLSGAAQLENFFRNIPSQFDSQSAQGGSQGGAYNLSTYIEDSIKLSRRFTLILGLRHDFFSIPVEKYGRMVGILGNPFPLSQIRFKKPGEKILEPDYLGFGPRMSFAYSPNSNLVIRGGYGIFIGQNYPALSTGGGGSWTPPIIPKELFDPDYRLVVTTFRPGDVPNFVYPNVSFVTKEALLKDLPPQAVNLSHPDWDNSYTHQWSLRVERQFFQSTRVSVGYVGTKSKKIIADDRYNLIRPLQGNTRENPLFNTISIRGPLNNADYNSLQVTVAKHMSYGLAFNVHYTWSHSLDDLFGFAGGVNDSGVTPQLGLPWDPGKLRANWGNSATDVRHDLTGC